jgi:alpha-D-ribose 1-methylphosphonate 5-triphosphate synthase subunit PhnH
MDVGDLDGFCLGSDEHPETSTTLVIDVDGLVAGNGMELAGPGIADRVALQVEGVSDSFWSKVSANHALFPRGVDLILTSGCFVAALPRSVRVLKES